MSRTDGAALAARLPISPGVRKANPQLFGDEVDKVFAPLPSERLAREVYGKAEIADGRSKIADGGPRTPNSELRTPRPRRPGAPREHTLRLNAVERRMRDLLAERLQRGEIAAFRPLALRLRYALDKQGHYLTYTPDFVVTEKNGGLTMLETKGKRAFNKAVSRFKACRADWPQFDFEMWQWAEGKWAKIL